MSQLNPHSPIPLEDIRAAQRRIRGAVVRTPLVRLNIDHAPSEIYLKLENLQPVGSFKIRGAYNAMAQFTHDQLSNGVWTVSAGNMAQARKTFPPWSWRCNPWPSQSNDGPRAYNRAACSISITGIPVTACPHSGVEHSIEGRTSS